MLSSLLAEATQLLAAYCHAPDSARMDAYLLMQEVLGVNRAWLISHPEYVLAEAQQQKFQTYLEQRMRGEPIAYILGYREFFGMQLKVNRSTLIPRPDTETLVEATLQGIPTESTCQILDLATGSGAVALALAKARPMARVIGTDISPSALQIAIENSVRLGLNHVRFMCSDWFSALMDLKFDVIVSNPPYIADGDEHLRQGDLRFEPMQALASGSDGLDALRNVIRNAACHLTPGGQLLVEHGYDQADQVSTLFRTAGYCDIRHFTDLAGILRVTAGYYRP